MKYLVIAGSRYYPLHYGKDIRASFATVPEAQKYIIQNLVHDKNDWWCIFDTDTLSLVGSNKEQ